MADVIDDQFGNGICNASVKALPALYGATKRRRIDEDIIKEVAVGVRAKRTHNAAQYGRATGTFGEATGRRWEEMRVKKHVVACQRSLTCSSVVGTCEDGSRNGGAPKEETIVHLLWDVDAKAGAVLPITVEKCIAFGLV